MTHVAIEPLVFLGWLAVIGGILNAFGDWALLGFPVAGKAIRMELIKEKPVGKVRLGAYIGFVAIPLWLGAVFPIARLLRAAPAVYTILAVVGVLLFVLFSQTYHVSYVFYGIVYRSGDDRIVAESMTEKQRMLKFYFPATLLMSLALVVGGVIAGAPIWWLVLNPMLTLTVLPSVGKLLPRPIGGYLVTGGGSLGFALFALATMLAV